MRRRRRTEAAWRAVTVFVAGWFALAGCGSTSAQQLPPGDQIADIQSGRFRQLLNGHKVYLSTRSGRLKYGADGNWYLPRFTLLRASAKREPDDAAVTYVHNTFHLELPAPFNLPKDYIENGGYMAVDPSQVDPQNSQTWPLFVPLSTVRVPPGFVKVEVAPAPAHAISEYLYRHTLSQLTRGQKGFFDPIEIWQFDDGTYSVAHDAAVGSSATQYGTATAVMVHSQLEACVPKKDSKYIQHSRFRARGGLPLKVTVKPSC